LTAYPETKRRLPGDLSGEATPGPIPNPAVKLVSTDGTWGVSPRESRSSPGCLLFVFLGKQYLPAARLKYGLQQVSALFGCHQARAGIGLDQARPQCDIKQPIFVDCI